MKIKDSIYEKFLEFVSDYRFKAIVSESTMTPIKFFGITIKRKIGFVEREKLYNDFTFSYDNDGVLLWQSGVYGGYRPEGYFMGGKFSDDSIRTRLTTMIEDFNEKYPHYKLIISDRKLLIENK